jgi:HSP20 family protein
VAFTRWDPLQDLLALHERINRMGGDEPGWMPPVDLLETPDAYVITAELPGLSRDNIQLQVHEGKVTLRGERPGRGAACEQYHRVERGHGQFSRTFSLPVAIDAEGVIADFDAGVLTVRIPKSGGSRQRRIEVQ